MTGDLDVVIWNVKTKRIAFARKGKYFGPIAFSPTKAVFTERRWANVFQLSSFPKGKKAQALDTGRFGALALAFAPDGSELAIALRDGTLRLYPIQ